MIGGHRGLCFYTQRKDESKSKGHSSTDTRNAGGVDKKEWWFSDVLFRAYLNYVLLATYTVRVSKRDCGQTFSGAEQPAIFFF